MPARLEKLKQADAALDKVRIYLRLAVKWQWWTPGQYQHAAAVRWAPARIAPTLPGRGDE
ncbi:MAG: hypothetical protein FJ011_26020 [Chloroflexi bacterium]|nr:hypothetical protein [Chloroflexota bacterium]